MATRFLYSNLWSSGAATASSSALAFDPNSTRNPLRGLPWRSGTVAADVWIANNFGSVQSISAVAVISPVISGLTVTAKVQKSTDGSVWTDVTGGALPFTMGRTNLWAVWFPTITTQYLRVLFTRSAGTGYIQIGTIYAGVYFEPTYSIDVTSFSIERDDLSVLTKGRSGVVNRSIYNQFEKFPLNFQTMPAADGIAFRSMFQVAGIGGMVILTLDETNIEYTWYGYFEAPLVTPATDIPDVYNIQLKFCEAL
jgi:hypothetical protein